MATVLSFLSGRQITNSNGTPQAGALLYHYRATTTTALTVYSNQAGTTPHAQPVVCDAGGFVPLIYVDDSFDWKVIIQTSAAVTLATYDNLPKAQVAASAANFAAPLLTWNQKVFANSPVTLAAADAGNAYEADTTSGSITFNLPSAASVGNGKGFVFKKTASANSMIVDPSGSETIDDTSTSFTTTTQYEVLFIASNGAEWYVAGKALEIVPTGRLVAASDTAQGAIELAVQSEMETATDVVRAVVPGRQHFHPGHPKFWAYVTVSAGTPALTTSYNVTSVTDSAQGDLLITIATDFSSASWCCAATVTYLTAGSSAYVCAVKSAGQAAGTVSIVQYNTGASANATLQDVDAIHAVGFGDQA